MSSFKEKLATLECPEYVVGLILYSLIIILAFAQVLVRYVFKIPAPWLEELCKFFYVWMNYFCGAFTLKLDAHIRLGFAHTFLKKAPRVYDVIQFFVYIAWLAFGIWMMYIGWDYMMRTTQESVILKFSYKYLYAAVPVGYLFMNIRLVQKIIRQAKIAFGPRTAQAQ